MDATAPIVAAIAAARRRVVRQLRQADATSPATAIPLAPSRRLQRKALAYLAHRKVVVEAAPGAYWLDESRHDEWRAAMRTRIAIAFTAVATAALAAYALGR